MDIMAKFNKKPITINELLKWNNNPKINPRTNRKISKNGDYMCKSCDEMLSLQKFIYEGTYVDELDTFMTTNIAVNQRLEEIPKYSKYLRTIRNLEKK